MNDTYRCMVRIMPTPTLEEDKQGLLTSITSSTIFSRISSKLNVCPRNRAIKSEWLWFSFSFFYYYLVLLPANINFEMIPNITSSAPPPIETRRRSRYIRDMSVSFMKPIPP